MMIGLSDHVNDTVSAFRSLTRSKPSCPRVMSSVSRKTPNWWHCRSPIELRVSGDAEVHREAHGVGDGEASDLLQGGDPMAHAEPARVIARMAPPLTVSISWIRLMSHIQILGRGRKRE